MQETATSSATNATTPANATGLVTQGQSLIEDLTVTRGRAMATGLVILCALLVALVVIPLVIHQLQRIVQSRFLDGRVADGIELFGEYIPTTMSGIVLRVTQLSVLVLSVLALLLVWGLVDIAVATVRLIVAAFPHLVNGVMTVVLILLAYVGSDQLTHGINRFSKGADRVTEHQEEVMLRVGQLVMFVGVGSAVLTLWGVDLSGLLVGAGFLGIVVGLAARQTLGSLIAGFVLMFSRPFTVGDWIVAEDQQGIVTDITILNTRLKNFDGESIVIPNDKVNDRSVTNRSANGRLRLRTTVGIDYDSDPDLAEEVALDAIEDVDMVENTPAPQVVTTGFGDSSIDLELRYWIEHPSPPRKWKAVTGVVQNVKAAFDEKDIAIPFPQRELSAREAAADALRESQFEEPEGGTEDGTDRPSEPKRTD